MFSRKKWKRRESILLLERLELYISSGLTINKTLEIIETGLPIKQQTVIRHIRTQIVSGLPLSRLLTNYIGISGNIAGLIEQGEQSGKLAQALSTGHKLLEKEDDLYKKCMSALAYPVIIGIFAAGLTLGLIRGVMPQIIPMLKSLNIKLPLITKVVIFISENLITYGVYIILTLIVGAIVHILLLKKSIGYRKTIHTILIRIPLIGNLIYTYSLSLFLHSCGVLIESGVSVIHAYTNTSNTVSLLPLSRLLKLEIQNIHKGIPLGALLMNKSKRIPAYVPSLILAGEASGTLGISLSRAAAILDRDMEHSLKRLTSLIEPVMMAGMGFVVGGIA
ncbi:MAG: type II secretion system F family protein, partial [bacterium]|nr:type II secretion system F family protein [bacterium]